MVLHSPKEKNENIAKYSLKGRSSLKIVTVTVPQSLKMPTRQWISPTLLMSFEKKEAKECLAPDQVVLDRGVRKLLKKGLFLIV